MKKNKIMGFSLGVLMLTLPTVGVFANTENTANNKIEKVVEVKQDKATKRIDEEQISNALYGIIEAKERLNTDYKELLMEEIKRESFIRDSKDYNNASEELKHDYENAIAASKTILNDKEAKKEQFQNALYSIREIESNITKDYKIALKNEIKYSEEVLKSNVYKNANVEKSTYYVNGLAAAKIVDKENRSEEEIKNALLNLREAREDMDVRANFKKDLEEEIAKESKVKASDEYKNAKIELSAEYDKSLSEAKALLKNNAQNSEELNISLFSIKEARKNLGFNDLTLLKETVEDGAKVIKSNEYKNATDEDQANYDNALAASKVVVKENK